HSSSRRQRSRHARRPHRLAHAGAHCSRHSRRRGLQSPRYLHSLPGDECSRQHHPPRRRWRARSPLASDSSRRLRPCRRTRRGRRRCCLRRSASRRRRCWRLAFRGCRLRRRSSRRIAHRSPTRCRRYAQPQLFRLPPHLPRHSPDFLLLLSFTRVPASSPRMSEMHTNGYYRLCQNLAILSASRIGMKLSRSTLLSLLIASPAFVHPSRPQAQAIQNPPQPQFVATPPAGSMIVYVSDFDLDVVYAKPTQRPVPRRRPPVNSSNSSGSTGTAPKSTPGASTPPASQTPVAPDSLSKETPADRANALVNAMSENLIRALRQAGYDARRLLGGAALPKLGLRIRG